MRARLSLEALAAALILAPAALAAPQAGLQDVAESQLPGGASGGVLMPEQAAFDVLSYELDLLVNPAKRDIHGTATMHAHLLRATDFVVLQLAEQYEVTSVLRTVGVGDGAVQAPVRFERRGGELWFAMGDVAVPGDGPVPEFSLRIAYGGTPREAPRPPWDGGFTFTQRTPKFAQPWITTTCQGEGADLWWPCKDHPSDEPDSYDLRVTVPGPLMVVSNGKLVSDEPAVLDAFPEAMRTSWLDPAKWHTVHWHVSTPINNYSIALNIAPYKSMTTQFQGVSGEPFEFTFWYLSEHEKEGKGAFLKQATASFEEFQRELAFFEDVCGPYPFRADKYGVVETPHLGMEHQTIIAYGNKFKGDPDLGFDYDWLHHHELSHEWWGNLVTAADWNDFWIHEGIGTYMQALYLERRFGEEAYRKKLASDLKRVKNKGAVAPRDPRTTKEMYFSAERPDAPDIDVYMKGSWICHTLRWVLGDDTFFTVLRRWAYPDPALEATTDGSACRFATTDELLEIAERVSERELGWFFELYLRQPELPRLEATERDGGLDLKWITPAVDGAPLPFPMPVEVQVGDSVQRVPMEGGVGRVELGGADWKVDPAQRILMAR